MYGTQFKRSGYPQHIIPMLFNIGVQSSDAVIVQTIIGMAKNLDMEVIAEGVETEQQRNFLELNGCNYYQGYLFSKPVPIEAFEALLKKG